MPRTPAILALLLSSAAAQAQFPNVSAVCAHLLHSDLDSMVPPGYGTDVKVQIVVFKIVSVDLTQGHMSLKMWLRHSWNDPRLSWDPAAFGGVESIRVYPGKASGGVLDGIDNQMWMPDLHWYNSLTEWDNELGAAKVESDGSVLHSAPGRLELSCRFTGLVNFPRDEISCPFDVGSWGYSDNVVNLTFFDNGPAEIGSNQETSGTSYSEYALTRLDGTRRQLPAGAARQGAGRDSSPARLQPQAHSAPLGIVGRFKAAGEAVEAMGRKSSYP